LSLFLIRMFSQNGLLDFWGKIVLIIGYASIFGLFVEFGQGKHMLKNDKIKFHFLMNVQMNSFMISFIFIAFCYIFKTYISTEIFYASLFSCFLVFFYHIQCYVQKLKKYPTLFSFLNSNTYLYIYFFMISSILFFYKIDIKFFYSILMLFLLGTAFFFIGVNYKKILSYKYNLIESSKILIESKTFFFTSIISTFLAWSDTIFVGYFCTHEDVSIYNSLFKISSLMTIVLSLLNNYVAPRISEAYSKGTKELKELILPYNRLALVISLFFYCLVIFFSKYIFNYLLIDYNKTIVTSLYVIGFGYLINAGCGNIGFILQFTKNERQFTIILGIALLLNIFSNLLLTPKFGILGAATSSTISMAFWNICSLFFCKRKLGFLAI